LNNSCQGTTDDSSSTESECEWSDDEDPKDDEPDEEDDHPIFEELVKEGEKSVVEE